MYLDDRIIARQSAGAGGLCVLAHADTMQLRDGSTAQLHTVHANGLPMLTLRALATTTGHLQLVDLASLVRRLDRELRVCPKRDVPGHVMYTLRQHFDTGLQLSEEVARRAIGSWWPVADGYVWHPAARALDGEVLRIVAAQVPEQGCLWGTPC